jgi:hypothetical protein
MEKEADSFVVLIKQQLPVAPLVEEIKEGEVVNPALLPASGECVAEQGQIVRLNCP